MAFLNWFSKKSDSSGVGRPASAVQNAYRGHGGAPSAVTPTTASLPTATFRPPADPTDRSEERKAKRHVRREQLYLAIRQAMTRSGVLSASYKFKVLSLDQRGDRFLVMMDVHPTLGMKQEKMLQTEALVMQIAKAQFGMLVSAVYWRMDVQAGLDEAKQASESLTSEATDFGVMTGNMTGTMTGAVHGAAHGVAHGATNAAMNTAVNTAVSSGSIKKATATCFEPIGNSEINASKRAMVPSAAQTTQSAAQSAFSASNWANSLASSATVVSTDSAAKNQSGLHSYTLLTGFEDTEMPEMAELPALSATQYGDLN